MAPRTTVGSWGLPAVVSGALLAVLASPWPDDWDTVGFVRAVTDFSLPRFQPHAPGYPVYVALARLLHGLGFSSVASCAGVSALGGALAVAAVARFTRTPWTAPLVLASPVWVLAATSARSDALGAGLGALGAVLAPGAPCTAAVLLALALGARPSYAPLVVAGLVVAVRPMAPGAARRAASVVAVAATVCALWVLGLLWAAGGPAPFMVAAREQVRGHLGVWGNTVLTQPGWHPRGLALAKGVLHQGLGISRTPWGMLRGTLWLALTLRGAHGLGRRMVTTLALALLPYGLWVGVAQNPDAPRHGLPVVLAVVAVASAGLARVGASRTGWLSYGIPVVLAGVLAVPAATTGWIHRTRAPAAVQAAVWVRAQSPGVRTVVFGGRPTRVMDWAGTEVVPRTWMGEVDVTLTQMDRLPPRVWVTDDVQYRDRGQWALGVGRRFCRDAWVDGTAACVTVYPYDVLGQLRR